MGVGFPGKPWSRTALYATVAAGAMVATLPGRTHGLGLITEPLLIELKLDRVAFAAMNLWATLIGAAFCIPCGWCLDRWGIRRVMAFVLLALGGVVVAMAHVQLGSADLWHLPGQDWFVSGSDRSVPIPADLFLLILLTRGLGQSALSVVSLALIGKVAGKRSGPAIGLYSFLVSIGFMLAFREVKIALEEWHTDWRTLWAGIGWIVVAGGVVTALFLREPKTIADGEPIDSSLTTGYTLGRALRTPTFWLFGLATSHYGMIAAGVSLFNQSILAERGFDRSVYLTISMVAPLIGLAANLVTGWLAARFPLGWLLSFAMVVLAGALLAFPYVDSLPLVYAYAAAMGIAGGMVTVLFFTVWSQVFGTPHLGRIQGAAQLLTVLASAVGPLLLAASLKADGSYTPLFQKLAYVSLGFALLGLIVPLPKQGR